MRKEFKLRIGIKEYIEHLEAVGKRPSTVKTAQRTMDLFIGHLGEGKEVAKIMPVHVAGFFKSEAATTLRDKLRAKASILQIRRIVRDALVYWYAQGYLDSVPLPKNEKKFLEPSNNGKATVAPAAETTEAQPEPVEPEQTAAESN